MAQSAKNSLPKHSHNVNQYGNYRKDVLRKGLVSDRAMQLQHTASGFPPSLNFYLVSICSNNCVGLAYFSRCYFFIQYNCPTTFVAHLPPPHNTHASSKLRERSVSHFLGLHLLYMMNRAAPGTPTVSCKKP